MPSSFTDPSSAFRRAVDRCAIPGLIRFVVLFNALVFVLHLLVPGFTSVLELDPQLVLQGQIWRLLTWIFIPETFSPFWIFFSLLFLFYIGEGLESAIGSPKLTFFYVGGAVLCTIVSFAFGLTGAGPSIGRANTFLNLSLLLAYATVFPDFKVLVFFVIPMRIAWLAIISAVLMILSSLGQPPVVAATLGAAFLNYFLFFHRELRNYLGALHLTGSIRSRTARSKNETVETLETLHRCEACGRTEISHPDLDFRVSANGAEYCRDHLSKS